MPARGDATITVQARRRALWWSLVLNGGFVAVEVAGGVLFGSLALLADAVHMGSDVGALVIALVALQVASRPVSERHTYGLPRAEVLGALVNSVVLAGVAVWIGVEAVGRLGEEREITGAGVAAVALVGLLINLASAALLARTAGRSLNMRGALWHMLSDALGSLAALVAGLAVVGWSAEWVDLAASLLIAVLVAVGAWQIMRDATRILLEATPSHLDAAAVRAAMLEDPEVDSVHHLHLWSIGSESEAMSGHVVVAGEPDLHDAQVVAARLKTMLRDRFDIDHSSLEVECHPCAEQETPARDAT